MASDKAVLAVHIVDDDESVRRSFARLMRASGIKSQVYQSPEDFLSQVDSDSNGCILMDITMPRICGFEFIRILSERGYAMPIVAMSARDDNETRALLRELGVNFYLRKPVDDQALIDAINWVSQKNIGKNSQS